MVPSTLSLSSLELVGSGCSLPIRSLLAKCSALCIETSAATLVVGWILATEVVARGAFLLR